MLYKITKTVLYSIANTDIATYDPIFTISNWLKSYLKQGCIGYDKGI